MKCETCGGIGKYYTSEADKGGRVFRAIENICKDCNGTGVIFAQDMITIDKLIAIIFEQGKTINSMKYDNGMMKKKISEIQNIVGLI